MPGGRFICLNFGIDEKGRYLSNTGGQHMFDHFTNAGWRYLRMDQLRLMNIRAQALLNIIGQWMSSVLHSKIQKVASEKLG